MARPAKRTPEVIELVLERIRQGEYARKALPSTRSLAEELGVSKFTIYRAYLAAEKKGLMKRVGRKWRAVDKGAVARPLEVAYIVPVADTPSSFLWFSSLDEVVTRRGGRASLVDYNSPTDSRLIRTLRGNYDVIFFNPPHVPIPSLLERLLYKHRSQVVAMYQDLPKLDIWGIDNMPVEAVDLLIFHLASKGIREIHLVGSQTFAGRQAQLVERWSESLSAVKASGEKFLPDKWEDNLLETAVQQTRKLLSGYPRPASIIFCDLPSAIGGYRALWEAGLRPGRDVPVAALVCEPEAMYLTPNLTSIVAPPRTSVLDEALDEVLAKKAADRRKWAERALSRVRLFEGESSRSASSFPTPG
jgi:DNA-binding LacI/PurR family transcriptional regulator